MVPGFSPRPRAVLSSRVDGISRVRTSQVGHGLLGHFLKDTQASLCWMHVTETYSGYSDPKRRMYREDPGSKGRMYWSSGMKLGPRALGPLPSFICTWLYEPAASSPFRSAVSTSWSQMPCVKAVGQAPEESLPPVRLMSKFLEKGAHSLCVGQCPALVH